MCRVISDAVTEGREIARRRGARAGTRSEDAPAAAVATAPRPQRTADEEREFQAKQAAARDAAASKQREIEERARQAKEAAKDAPAAEADTPTEADTPASNGAADANPEPTSVTQGDSNDG
jgi:hypothetical protein